MTSLRGEEANVFHPPLVLIESTGGATRQQWQITHSHWPTISLSDSSQRVREKLGLMPLYKLGNNHRRDFRDRILIIYTI